MEDQIKLKTWVCPHCYKKVSPNYKYKSHVKRCLCFKSTSDHHQQAIFEIKTELKNELANMLRDAVYELEQELKSPANQSPSAKSVEPLVKKKVIGSIFY